MSRLVLPLLLGLWSVSGASAAGELRGGEPEPTFKVEFRDKPWSRVIEWFSDISGLTFVGVNRPTGTLNFVTPRGKERFTIAEIIDLINEGLLTNRDTQKYVLIRRNAFFTLVPIDEQVSPLLVERVDPEELSRRGKSEIVRIVVPLHALNAENLLPEIKRLLGPLHVIEALNTANALLLQDRADNLQSVVGLIKQMEKSTARSTARLLPAGSQDAAALAIRLQHCFPDAAGLVIEADVQRNVVIVKGTAAQVADVERIHQIIGAEAEGLSSCAWATAVLPPPWPRNWSICSSSRA